VRILCPPEGSRVGVDLRQEAVDCGLKVDDRAEHAAFEAPLGELGEITLDRVQPGGRCRGEVEAPPRMPSQPFLDLRVLMGGVVVDDGVDCLALWYGGLGHIEKADELLMPVPLHAAADHRAVQHVEGGKQGRGAIALVIVGHRTAAALFHRQARLCPVKRLNLALFVDRQNDSMLGRIDVEPDDIEQFGGKLRIFGQLEQTGLVWLEAVFAPDALHRTDADADVFGHRTRGPMRGLTRCRRLRGGHHAGLDLGSERRNARRAGLIAEQTGHAFGQEALLLAPDRRLARAGAAGEFHRAATLGGQQHDLRPPDMLLRAVAVRHDGAERQAVGFGEVDCGGSAHPSDSHGQVSVRILNRMQMSDFIH
jgi:hypothetical protein